MPDAITLAAFLAAVALGQSLLSASVLGLRTSHRQVHLPLAIFFLCMAISGLSGIIDAPAFQTLPKPVLHLTTATSFPIDVLILPLFWFYVRALTSEREQPWSNRDFIHLLPATVGCLTFIILIFTPESDRTALFDTGRDHSSTIQTVLFFLIIGLYVVWLCQWLFYALIILKRLVRYRARLKDLFATTEHLELRWIGWLGLLILVDWAWVALTFVLEIFTDHTPFEEPWLSVLDLILIWTLSIWGLRQTPGLAAEVTVIQDAEGKGARYEKSALGVEQIERLAGKIEAAMRDQQLYRDPDLSLSLLAKHISARPNYISQALNAGLDATFFDYVNQWRVTDAKAQLETSSDTVLEIAFAAGFNTRSSFYTAFKRYVGSTPTAWRKERTEGKTSTK